MLKTKNLETTKKKTNQAYKICATSDNCVSQQFALLK